MTRALSTLSSSLSIIMTPPATIITHHEPNPPFDSIVGVGRAAAYNNNNNSNNNSYNNNYSSSNYQQHQQHQQQRPHPGSIYSNASFSSSSSTFTISAMPSASQGEEVFVEGLPHSEARLEARLVFWARYAHNTHTSVKGVIYVNTKKKWTYTLDLTTPFLVV
jgi:hypothetical protein